MIGLGVAVAVLAVIAAYGVGYLVGARSASIEKCQQRIDELAQQRDHANQAAAMWQNRAGRLQGRLQQLDRDVTASTEMLLAEIDQAAGVGVCEHGKRTGCDWCDQPAPYALAPRARRAAVDA